MTALALTPATRTYWQSGDARVQYGHCDDCGRIEDEDGRSLLVARQKFSKRFQCLTCFAANPTGSGGQRARHAARRDRAAAKATRAAA